MPWKLLFNRYTLGALVVLGVIWAIHAAGASSARAKLQPVIKALEQKVDKRTDERDAYAKALKQSEAYRAQEAQLAQDALTASRQACLAKLDDVRKAEAAKRRIHLKPVKFDAKGCPDRTLVPTSEWSR